MDSCVTTANAKNESDNIAFLHANYGQRTEKRELQAFNEIADFYKVEQKLILDFKSFSFLTDIYCVVLILFLFKKSFSFNLF